MKTYNLEIMCDNCSNSFIEYDGEENHLLKRAIHTGKDDGWIFDDIGEWCCSECRDEWSSKNE